MPVTSVSKKQLDNPPKIRTQEMLEDLFPGEKSRVHHHDICDPGCTFSREEISRQLEANKGKKKSCLITHGCAKLTLPIVQQADTGGLCL